MDTRVESKTYLAKVYDENDAFLGVLDDIIGDPTWSQQINSIGSTCSLELARTSDSKAVSSEPILDNLGNPILDSGGFPILGSTDSVNKIGPGSNISHNYRVDLFVFYGDTDTILDNMGLPILDNYGEPIMATIGAPNGARVFTGFISEINTRYGDTDTTQILLMSYGWDLDQYTVETSGGATTVPYNSMDPSQMVRTSLDRFKILAGGESYTDYTTASVQNTGTTVSYTFKNNTYKEILDKCIELAPSNWYYYVDLGNNLVNFLPKPSTPSHTFFLGKHIKTLELKSYIGDVVNDVRFTGGGDPSLYKKYVRTVAAGTRRSLNRISDSRVTLEDSADIISNGELDEKGSIQYRSTIEILSNGSDDRDGYDLESIKLGQTINLRNFDNYVDGITMQIVGLTYTADVLTLNLDTLPVPVDKRLEDLRRNAIISENQNIPATPDV